MSIADLVSQEKARQAKATTLIASENYASEAVKAALASDFTNKYSEGYPGKRYYAGNAVVDELESSVQKLAQKVFHTDYHVNVQAYSGSIANLAIFYALLQPHDPFMGLELSHGGHLTHGHPVTISGKLYDRYAYFVDQETGLIDYDQLESEAREIKPKLIISGASAYSRTIDFERIGKIAKEVGAYHLADISHISGLIATGLHPTPFGHADIIMTTTHKILRGPRGALIFSTPELAEKIDKAIFPGIQGGPHMNTIAAIGVCLEEASDISYKVYCETVIANAKALAEGLKKEGLTPISGGTDNHLMLVDLRPLGISGQEAQDRLEKVGLIVNKNAIPYDEAPPSNPSGIRLGTPALTTRGLKPADMPELAKKIAKILKNH
ncbi:MAG TPA: serine hydroxymethyltransferase [Candidatus Saccharimonadales bacterium]|nr:serine hydroxymethyltransferase [Candidatus Saccharimonadales bacterium]